MATLVFALIGSVTNTGASSPNVIKTCTNVSGDGSIVTITHLQSGKTHTIMHKNSCPSGGGGHHKKSVVTCTVGPLVTSLDFVDQADSNDEVPPSSDTTTALDVQTISDAETIYDIPSTSAIVADPDICP
jgi:hypothetical protein